ncbi:MAG: hypothetical protein HY552_03510 [Elusimicrobia bacterium]|nr:hypothetical protein [Elusimicrobiota bacterium]
MGDLTLRFDVRLGPRLLRGAAACAILAASAAELGSENVTLTTYYPAPSGIYTRMITTGDTQLARDGGSVLIGPTGASTAKLAVAGAVKIADGTQGAGKVLVSDASGNASWAQGSSVPTGAVMFFALGACPSGWLPYAGAQGRYLVGRYGGNLVGGTVGTALTNGGMYMENRASGRHVHYGWTANMGNFSAWNTVGAYQNRGAYPGPQGSYQITDNGDGADGKPVMVPGTNAPYVQLLACYKQ